MSVSFVWEPIKQRKRVPHGGTSSDRKALEDTFGSFPLELGPEDLKTLRAMARGSNAHGETLYDGIAEIIERLDAKIRIDAEY